MPAEPREIGVAVVGFGWMGRVHAQSYARVAHHYPELGIRPRLRAVADDVPGRAAAAAAQFGAARSTEDWRDLLGDATIDAVSITAPNFLHREIAIAFAEAGKHVWVEKPVGVTADDTRAVRDAIRTAGIRSAIGFNYRNAPAVQDAIRRVRAGEIGEVTHVSARLLSDYAADADGAFSWRYELERAGHGVLGDLASHGVDLLIELAGEVREVMGDGTVFIPERRRPSGATVGHARAIDGVAQAVENEDWAAGLLRFASGARGTLEVSRVAVGEQNDYGFVVHGTSGMLAWDFRRMGELLVAQGSQDAPAARVLVGPSAGDYGAFQPGAAIAMGYDDLKVIEAERFLRSIAEGRDVGANIDDAVRMAEVLDALARSTLDGAWTAVVPGAATAAR